MIAPRIDVEPMFVGSVAIVPGPRFAFADFAGGSDYNALAVSDGNVAWIEDDWREKDTMATVGKFIGLFRKLGLVSHQIGGDQGFGGALMDRLAEKREDIVFGLPLLQTVLIPLLDGLPTVDWSYDRHKNTVLCVQRTKSSRVMIVDCLVVLLINRIIQLLD